MDTSRHDLKQAYLKGGARVLDVEDVRALEGALEQDGIDRSQLMRNAGEQLAGFVCDYTHFPVPICILCGAGNNGGDGWVAAGMLAKIGFSTAVVTPVEPDGIKAQPARDAALEALAANAGEGSRLSVFVDPTPEELDSIYRNATLVLDALLGMGFEGDEVREPYALWINRLNDLFFEEEDEEEEDDDLAFSMQIAELTGNSDALMSMVEEKEDEDEDYDGPTRPLVVSVDVPSGMNAQTGALAQPTVHADYTIPIMIRKPGHMEPAARSMCGHMVVAHIADITSYVGTFG